MKDFRRERKMVWYIVLVECVVILFTIRAAYGTPLWRLLADIGVCLAGLAVTRILAVMPGEKCSDFLYGAITLSFGMAVCICYSLESGSDRMLPMCMFFALAESMIFKNVSLHIFVTAMNIFVCVISTILSSLGLMDHAFGQIEFMFVLLVMVVLSAVLMFTLSRDLFLDRVAREDEKSLDDLLQLVEMKCEEATAAAEAKSSFLANMSHEIRTPINAVLGMNEMILRENEDEVIRGYAQNIQSAGQTLLSLINDILDISKIESGKMELVPEKYQLNELLYDILLVIQPRMEKKGLRLVLDIDEKIPNDLFGDEVRIRQIITNILTNAVKYTEEGSVTLRVAMKKMDEDHIMLHVSVADTGIGIKETKEVLFASFQRGGDLRAHHIEGTGLGLSITQQLLEMMGSDLQMESKYGKGSTFSFDLLQKTMGTEPMGNLDDLYQKRLAQEQKYRESFTAPDARVLVVDDNVMNQTVVKSLLKKTQVQIDSANDGAACLEKCKLKHYDLILMDHLMPNMDGIEAFHALRADKDGPNATTPVIVLTANAVAGMKQQYMDEGFNGFLSKPIQAQLLEETLRHYLPGELVTLTERKIEEDAEEERRRDILQNAADRRGLTDLALDDALQYSSGTIADVLDNIKSYLSESGPGRDRIRREYDTENWNDFKIHVHALKSTSGVIGAVHMSYSAKRMEEAAASGDLDYIRANFDTLVREHEQLCADLGRVMADPSVQAMMPEAEATEQEPSAYVAEAEEILRGVKEYDVDFERLREFCNRYPAGTPLKEERQKLSRASEDFDYDEIERILEQVVITVKNRLQTAR